MTMNVPAIFVDNTTRVFESRRGNDDQIQALLYEGAYHALCGNSDPMTYLLRAAMKGKSTRISGITTWVAINLPMQVRDGGDAETAHFKLNKGWVSSEVKSREEFDTKVLPQLKKAGTWYEAARAPKAKNPWECGNYLNQVVDNLRKHGRDDLANEVLALKAKI